AFWAKDERNVFVRLARRLWKRFHVIGPGPMCITAHFSLTSRDDAFRLVRSGSSSNVISGTLQFRLHSVHISFAIVLPPTCSMLVQTCAACRHYSDTPACPQPR